jgi:hypothetical protein
MGLSDERKSMETGRIDSIIAQLQRLHRDAHGIMNAYVDCAISGKAGASFGTAKANLIAGPAGSALDYIKALEIIKEKMTT